MSSETPSQKLPGYVIFISSVAAIGGFLFGFDSGVINGTVEALQETFNASDFGTGFNVSSMLLGCALGAFIAGGMADKFGRKPVMIATAIGFLISAIGSGLANTTTVFVIFRFIGGVSVGAASVIAPAYIAEVSPAVFRGRLASLQQLAIVIGLFIAFISNYLIAKAAGSAKNDFWFGIDAWRWMFWIECIPAILFGIGAAIAPESPRYLVAKNKDEQAAAVLKRVHILTTVEQKIKEIHDSLRSQEPPKFRDVLEPGTSRIRTIVWIGIGLSVFQQFVGINVIFYYGAVLWKAAGFTEDQALLMNVISGFVNVSATFVAIATIDKIGRKPLLLVGSIGMALMLGAVAVVFASAGLNEEGTLALSKTQGLIALICVHLYIFAFAISWGPVVWVMLGEMFNNRYRGAALGIAASAQWFANFAITITFPVMLGTIGLAGAYGTYTFFALLSVAFVWFLIKETKGRELEEM
ncbi:MAG: sugar porter family MFS transporter [Sumerlaeia bacterium]